MSRNPEPSSGEWIKSTYSNGNGGSCVEWAPTCAVDGTVPVRDSKDPDGPALLFSADAWNGFIAALKTGQFPMI